MSERLVKLAEEASELSFAALKYRANPSARNKKALLDECADVLGAIIANKLEDNTKRKWAKVRKYEKLKG